MGDRHSDSHYHDRALPLRITADESRAQNAAHRPRMIKSIQRRKDKKRTASAIRATSRDDEEISSLYKKEGVNPAGGRPAEAHSIPILIAFPTSRMLGVALDLRHGARALGTDLSPATPYFCCQSDACQHVRSMQRMTPQAAWTRPANRK